jgi:signal transduction histidine kinase
MILSLVEFFMNTLLAIFVYFNDRGKASNILFAIFAISSSVWILSTHLAINTAHTLFFGRLIFTAVIVSIASLFFFAISFPRNTVGSKAVLSVLGLPPLAFFIASLTGMLVEKAYSIDGHLEGAYGPAYAIYKYFAVIYLLSTLAILVFKHRGLRGEDQQRIKYVLLGIGLFIVPSLFTNMILPAFFNNHFYNNLGPLFSIFMTCFIGYAVIRHQLLSISIIIQRSLIFSILSGLIVGFYLMVVFIIGELFYKFSSSAPIISAGLTTLAGIFGVPPIERRFQRFSDRFFYKNKYDFSAAVNELSEILNYNFEPETLVMQSSMSLKRILKVEAVAVVLWRQNELFLNGLKSPSYTARAFDCLSGKTELLPINECIDYSAAPSSSAKLFERLRNGLAIPVNHQDKLIATLIISEPLSGDPFSKEDLNLLKTFAHQAAVALEKARLLEVEKNHAVELEKKIKRRTNRIAALQEEQRKIMLNISHELQTPLTIVKIELERLKQSLDGNQEIINFEKSINWISKFIFDLLKLSRLETAISFEKQKFNLSDLLAELIEYFEILTNDKHIRLSHSIEPGIAIVADRRKIEELITNLMSNAVKYIANEKIISLKLMQSEKNAVFIIEDSGIGIKKENLSKLFDRYYMEQAHIDKSIRGSGLGLAIAKKIVQGHNGEITVASSEGRGSTFTVTLPLAG